MRSKWKLSKASAVEVALCLRLNRTVRGTKWLGSLSVALRICYLPALCLLPVYLTVLCKTVQFKCCMCWEYFLFPAVGSLACGWTETCTMAEATPARPSGTTCSRRKRTLLCRTSRSGLLSERRSAGGAAGVQGEGSPKERGEQKASALLSERQRP